MPTKRKDDVNDDAESVNSSNGSVSARSGSKRKTLSNNNKTLISEAKTSIEIAKELNDLLRNYRNDKGRLLTEHLIRLPSKRTASDYYELIKQPIDFNKIQQKFKSDEYHTFQQFEADIQLVFSNAKLYYQKDTTEYKDTVDLEEYYSTEKKKRPLEEEPEAKTQDESITDNEETESAAGTAITDDKNETTVGAAKKRGRSNVKNSPAKSSKHSETSILDESSSRSVRLKSLNAEKEANLSLYLEDYFDIICSFQDDSQRYLANVFYELPSVKDYPDYYETIKNPISLRQIAKKVLNSAYKSLKQMESDLSLMTDNAKRYNEPKSIIYKDACKLKRLTTDTYKELTSLSSKGKLSQSTKTREKKHKLVEEIAAGSGGPDEPIVNTNYEETNHNNEEEDDDEEEEDEDDDDDEMNESNEAAHNTVEAKRPRRKNNHLMPTMWSLFDNMKEFRDANHTLMDPFVKLPSKRIYPDYYEEIKKPIALNVIKKKLNKRLYSSIKELVDDFDLMFKNAMQYNLEESLIYKDAKRLKEVLHQKAAELPLLVSTAPGGSGAPSPAINNTPRKTRQILHQNETKEDNIKYATIPKFSDLKDKLLFLYNFILDFQIEKRDLAAPFRVLPAKTDYPDYYTVIKKPIDMTKIWNKINQHNHANGYTSLDEMCYDFAQMFENACIYNEPASKIYKDALSLQQAVFTKRDQIIQSELANSNLTSSNCFSKDPLNDFQNEIEFLKRNESLTSDFIQNAVQCLLQHLFESVLTYQDLETRTLSDSFVELYNFYDKKTSEPDYILTFELLKQRLNNRYYKRLDVFQDDLFQVFNQIRTIKFDSNLINENSQLYRDAYDLQRFFITKRDEVCRNGDLMQSSAAAFKFNQIDSQIASARGHMPQAFDEADLLLVDKRFKKLESQITPSNASIENDEFKYKIGHYYYIERSVISEHLDSEFKIDSSKEPLICCVLSSNSPQTKLIAQVYLKPTDTDFIDSQCLTTRKFFEREIFKSDIYVLLDVKDKEFKECFVVGVKEYMLSEPTFNDLVTKENLFICESIYSTSQKYFRKIINKKWSPLAFISSSIQVNSIVTMTRRSIPLTINRYYTNESLINELIQRVDTKLNEISKTKQMFKNLERQTVEYDSLPAALAAKDKEADEFEGTQIEDDPELMKMAKFYEQLVYKDGELYRVGDYVYVRHQNEPNKPPMIVRIDRLWSIPTGYYLRGALFLRPIEITHEPTRLFYKNEVFKEISREITANLDQIVLSDNNTNSKKCTVMNAKKYVSCRLTEIDEKDVYICETKYSLQLKTFRKFTKGLRKFELSVRCCEDEFYFLRRELQLKKHMSPILSNLIINYDEEYVAPEINGDYAMDANDSNEEDWSDGEGMMRDDENSSHSFNINSAHFNENSNGVGSPSVFKIKGADGSILKQKKVRVKRLKKSGYNLFSKDLRKRLRDTKSSLSFVNMSKEVGNRWRALSDQERASYEERAKIETIKEQQAAAAAASAAAANQQTNIYANQSPQLQSNIITNNQMYSSTASPQTIYLHQTPNGLVAKQGPVMLQNQPVYQNGTQYVTQTVYQPVYEQAQPQLIQQVQAPVQQIVQQQAPVAAPPPPKQDHPKSVQHKEAYIKYIANMRKQQQMYQSNSVSASITGITPDWYNSIDIRSNRIKESRIQPPSASWVESCNHNDMVKHLMSLRYYLLNDAINIEKYVTNSDSSETKSNSNQENDDATQVQNESIKTNETNECMIVE